MVDPLNPDGTGTGLGGYVDDVISLVTTNYVPAMIVAILFGVGLSIAFRWTSRAANRAGGR